MKTAKEIYEPKMDDHWLSFFNYQPMLEEFGEIVVQVDDDDYQGDSRVLYKSGDRFGYLQFGWGSCSGCDALQACNTYEDVQELMDALKDRIIWFDNDFKALRFFIEHDWKGDYSWHREEQTRFVNEVLNYLAEV